MKKVFFLLLVIVIFQSYSIAQCPQASAQVLTTHHGEISEVGAYNSFGVRITLAQINSEDVTVTGVVFDTENQSVSANFNITVTAGNLTQEADDLLNSGRESYAAATISTVSPCPPEYAEEIAATYSLTNHTYTINLSPNNEDITNALSELFSLESPVVDSMKINDDDPSTLDSAAYLVLYVTAINRKFSMGLNLDKENDGNDHILYSLNNSTASVAKAWECKKNTTCNSCVLHRNWFLGPVKGCDCGNSGQTNDCTFNTSGSGFPWGPVLGFLGVLITILHATN
jgi:hypothetical protein